MRQREKIAKRVGAREKTRARNVQRGTETEASRTEKERGREAELTRHGNGKWDATEYRWTLTGMRVRITGCHPYSAGLAAVSGQCHRYISIITFAIATAGCIPMHALCRTALRSSGAYLFRRPICIRYASALLLPLSSLAARCATSRLRPPPRPSSRSLFPHAPAGTTVALSTACIPVIRPGFNVEPLLAGAHRTCQLVSSRVHKGSTWMSSGFQPRPTPIPPRSRAL